MRLDLCEKLDLLLADVVEAARTKKDLDANTLVATDSAVRASFIEICREVRQAGSELALVEFGPVNGELRKVLSDPNDRGNWPIWNVLVSADSAPDR